MRTVDLSRSRSTTTALAVSFALSLSCASDDGARAGAKDAAPAAPLPDRSAEEAQELVERSGMGQKLTAASRVADFFVGNMRETAMRMGADADEDDAMLDRLTELALHSAGPAYASERTRAHVEEFMARAPEPVRAKALAHYRDARADRVALVHAELASPAGQQRLSRFLAEVRSGALDPTKVIVIEGMLGASREVDLTVALAFDTSSSFLHALEPALPSAGREPRERLLLRREAFLSSAKRQLTMQLAYVYSVLDDEDLQAEARFWASPEGRAFADLRVDAAAHAIARAEDEATARVLAALETIERERPPPPAEPDLGA